jgi:hypothetical protein
MTGGVPGCGGQAQPAHHWNLEGSGAALGKEVSRCKRPVVIVRGGVPCRRRRSRASTLVQSARRRGAVVKGIVLEKPRWAGMSRHEVREAALASPPLR